MSLIRHLWSWLDYNLGTSSHKSSDGKTAAMYHNGQKWPTEEG